MADRFPLILNTSNNQIQEIASGDNLDLTGSGISNAGIITAGNVTIGAATTDLIVTGDARVTGILTVGTGSLTLNGPNNLVNVGTALTLGHTQGLQFHTQNLHSEGFEINQINLSGIATFNEARFGNSKRLKFGDDIDLQIYHFSGGSGANYISAANAMPIAITADKVELLNQGHSAYYFKGEAAGSIVYHNNTARVTTTSTGINVAGNNVVSGNVTAVDGTFTGNVSIGGTLTYEDVTNIDSVGIITARAGINLTGGNINLGDSASASDDRLVFGASSDLSIYHVGGNHSFIKNLSNNLYITTPNTVEIGSTLNDGGTVETSAKFIRDGAVELYYDDLKKFETISTGAKFTSSRVQFHNPTSSGGYAQFSNLSTSHNSASGFWIGVNSSQQGVIQNKENHPIKFYTNDTIRWDIESGGHFVPQTNDNYDIGTSSYKVRNVYATTFSGSITATTGSFSGAITFSKDDTDVINFSANSTNNNRGIAFNGRTALSADYNDGYLRLNNASEFSNGVFTPGVIRADGGINWNGTQTIVNNSGQINGSRILTGTIPVAQIGTGTKNTSTFYRGDGTFATVTAPAITAINNATNNRVVTSEGGTTVNAESDLQFNGTHLSLGIAPGQHYYSRGIACHASGVGSVLHLTDSSSGSGQDNGLDIISHANSAYIWQRETANIIFGVGGNTKWNMDNDGRFFPNGNGTQDIGKSTNRVQNLYTSDLHLSNEAKGGNSIDNTWGDYTIQEGESDLFLINNRSGKKYKFNLTEVS